MKLPCALVGSIAEIVCAMFSERPTDLDPGQVGKMVGAVVRSWGHMLTGQYRLSPEDCVECIREGERVGKAFAEFFKGEEGG